MYYLEVIKLVFQAIYIHGLGHMYIDISFDQQLFPTIYNVQLPLHAVLQ